MDRPVSATPPASPHPTTAANAPVAELPKKYVPAEHEPNVSQAWSRALVFEADPARVLSGEREPYCILIPPPNVTARLHLGHALNNGLQDVLVRAHRMMGYETVWIPGTDHAGIATQTVVDKRLKEAGEPALADYKRREAEDGTGRGAFIGKVNDWATQYQQEITDQLKEIGCSCDWSRQRFTMDDICARAVREAFFRLFRDGLIYRGKRLVNWDPVTLTALADDEVEMQEVEGHFVYLRYPLVKRGSTVGDPLPLTWGELAALGFPAEHVPADARDDDQAYCTVATTRPETYMGDTAVALNPADPRAGALRGVFVHLPLVGRIIPIIEDDYVVMPDPEGDAKARMATGFLKVTPAHDPNDYDIGQRHFDDIKARNTSGEVIVNIMAPDASISDKHGWSDIGDARVFLGKSREEAATLVMDEFKSRGLLEKVVPYTHSVGHSYRSHVPIEPYMSDQWYCKVSDDRLVGEAQRALAKDQRTSNTYPPADGQADNAGDGAMRFTPDRYAKTYESWHDNLRDWCISRQLWWGHRIPVWSKAERDEHAMTFAGEAAAVVVTDHESHICLSAPAPELESRLEEAGYRQDPDVLDTWFSSALWPMSTMGWPGHDKEGPNERIAGLLDAFNPTSVLCTGRDIITLWVSRMVMFNRCFLRHGGTEARGHGGGEQPEVGTGGAGGAGPVPFWDVYINPIIQDGFGQRMSKSLGNGVDPLDIVHSHGADAMRFVLAKIATATQDVRMPVDLVCPHTGETFEPEYITSPQGYKVAAPEQTSPKDPAKKMVTAYGVASGRAKPTGDAPLARNTSSKFDEGRNFVTKLYNAARFTLSNLEGAADEGVIDDSTLTLTDRWMLSRLASTVRTVEQSIAGYAFSDYANALYDILWRDFCDWYLEAVKPTVKDSVSQRAVLRAALDAILRLLHPICPFVTEVLFEHVATLRTASIPGVELGASEAGPLAAAPWPKVDAKWIDKDAEQRFDTLRSLTEAIRQVRVKHKVGFKTPITTHVNAQLAAQVTAGGGVVETLANTPTVTADPPGKDAGAVPFVLDGTEHFISGFAASVDAGELRSQLEEMLAKLGKDIKALEGRLSNPGYVDKAPAHLVEQTREQLRSKQTEREQTKSRLDGLG
jgi:valyl-tRNA synthetase